MKIIIECRDISPLYELWDILRCGNPSWPQHRVKEVPRSPEGAKRGFQGGQGGSMQRCGTHVFCLSYVTNITDIFIQMKIAHHQCMVIGYIHVVSGEPQNLSKKNNTINKTISTSYKILNNTPYSLLRTSLPWTAGRWRYIAPFSILMFKEVLWKCEEECERFWEYGRCPQDKGEGVGMGWVWKGGLLCTKFTFARVDNANANGHTTPSCQSWRRCLRKFTILPNFTAIGANFQPPSPPSSQ